MIGTTVLPHVIILWLDDHDWKYFKVGCLNFIAALKEAIPSNEREYDSDTKMWTIHIKHRALIETLRQEHLVDKNQGDLFE